MRPALSIATLSVAAAILAAACSAGAAATPGPSASTALAGRTFVSTGSSGHDLVPGSQVRLVFRAGQDLGIQAGCNSMGASWSLEDGTLHVRMGVTTEMACPAPLMDQDTWIGGFLDGAAATLAGDTLTLANDGVTLTLMDDDVANPDRPLEGTTWSVEGLVRDQAVSSVPAGLTASLVFQDGKVAVNSGCNRGSGMTTISGDSITFGPIATTRMACPPPAMDLEQFVLGVLQGDVAYTIDHDTLHLVGSGKGLDLRAQP